MKVKNEPYLLRALSLSSGALLLVGGFLVDGNGRYPYLGGFVSYTITIALVTLTIIGSLWMFVVDRRWRIIAVLILIFLLVWMLPGVQ